MAVGFKPFLRAEAGTLLCKNTLPVPLSRQDVTRGTCNLHTYMAYSFFCFFFFLFSIVMGYVV